MAYWEELDLDDKTIKALKAKNRETRNKKILLGVSLVIIMIIAYILFQKHILSKEVFQIIFSAIIGGFIGSSFAYIIQGEK